MPRRDEVPDTARRNAMVAKLRSVGYKASHVANVRAGMTYGQIIEAIRKVLNDQRPPRP